jgi:hypothetical protein
MIAIIGSPAIRDATEMADRSFRSLAAPALSLAAITAATLATAKRAVRHEFRFGFSLRK